ncbi:sugar ABC transporter ATP-binding protein [Schumannella soli]|uniref:Sugar ABC transporter ATP-binding protein n=1 Tax=Schumannella soli TaxID=2590779 RepID=A0A506XWQ6_9MICO|nr:sugar ABC transporter ATP-binding protein [Schumannella soli]TPW74245.1 sugar ABC transporter ATP-binding protein [Schumannella soli]
MTHQRLEIEGLCKSFGSTPVLEDISLSIAAGEVRALIGQNGAGKSTLVKTLAGLYPDFDGVVRVDGRPVLLRSPRSARSEGIAVIHQEFSLVPGMTVAENILLGREPGRVVYRPSRIRRLVAELVDRIGISVGAALDTLVDDVGPAIRQRIEIVKALADDVSLLIMDEPTARLSKSERAELFDLMAELTSRGVAIVFISHYLDEVSDVTDSITILRNGRLVETRSTADTSVDTMASLMLGVSFQRALEQEEGVDRASDDSEVVLRAERISSGERLHGVSLNLRRGEILGLAGLVGAGRTRVCRALTGADRISSGALVLQGRPVVFGSPRAALSNGVALIPEDRRWEGLGMEATIAENLSLMALRSRLGRFGFVPRRRVSALAQGLVEQLQISPPALDTPVGTLSGGNQQKVLLGKALAARPDVLVIDQPTAGVDIGTKAQIHRVLRRLADAGTAVLVVSDDVEELYALSDRVDVMVRGAVTWSGRRSQLDYDRLLELISGATVSGAKGHQQP